MSKLWTNVTSQDVLQAIELFDRKRDKYPEPKNTFLLYNNRKYPAKHIRGFAYKIANKKEISKDDYSGGEETANFFKRLGFIVEYKKDTIALKQSNKAAIQPVITSKKAPSSNGKKLSVVSQKNALQKLLQRHYGLIEIEKKFDWLKTPEPNNLSKEYILIVEKLLNYRNHRGFLKPNYLLSCDIVLDDNKLIIEYDENQHFTKARHICLENYLPYIKLSYPKQTWLSACQKIDAKDNNPLDRDERRAFYDTVRDIEAFKHGYTLIRIKHGDVDWEAPSAEKHLENLLSFTSNKDDNKVINHKIARLIVTGKHYYRNGLPNYSKLEKEIEKFLDKAYGRQHFEFVLTPGGFLKFEFPKKLQNDLEIDELEQKYLPVFKAEAEKTIKEFLAGIKSEIFKRLKKTTDFLTIGIDGSNLSNDQHIELVAVYDLHKEKVVHWTGKFYPTENQKRNLIKINDHNSHFVRLNNQNVVILGCHDLNVFSGRGQSNANPNGWKRKTANKFKILSKKFNPTIFLHHPHTTFSPKIWMLGWSGVIESCPTVEHYASGIRYEKSHEGNTLRPLNSVLDKTKKGDVIDFTFDYNVATNLD